MSVLVTTATRTKITNSHTYAHPSSRAAGDSAVMVIPSKRREEVRTLDTGRRASVHWENDDDSCKERRGSKASSRRRQSVAKADSADVKPRLASRDHKKEVLVTMGR